MVAIIAKHKVFSRRHNQFAVLRQALQLSPPNRIDIGIGVDLRRKIVPERVGSSGLKRSIRLIESCAIHRHPPVFNADVVSGHADDPLHQVGRIGMMEHHDVAALHIAIRHRPASRLSCSRMAQRSVC